MGVVSTLQNFFFPKVPFVQPTFDEEGWFVGFGGSRKHKTMKMSEGEFTVRCRYSATHPFTGRRRESPAAPRPHWHHQQTEMFTVIEGTLGYLLDDKEHIANVGESVTVHPGKIHSFWCEPEGGKDLVVDITLRPGIGLDEDWFHSVYGYYESAYVAKKDPSWLAVMVFMDEGGLVPATSPRFIGELKVWLFGRWLGRMAGYKGIYPMYAEAGRVAQKADRT